MKLESYVVQVLDKYLPTHTSSGALIVSIPLLAIPLDVIPELWSSLCPRKPSLIGSSTLLVPVPKRSVLVAPVLATARVCPVVVVMPRPILTMIMENTRPCSILAGFGGELKYRKDWTYDDGRDLD